MTRTHIDMWTLFISRVGFPIAVASLLLFVGIRLGDKLVANHERFLESVQGTMAQQAKAMDRLAALTETMGRNQERTIVAQEEIVEAIREQGGVLTRIEEEMKTGS